MPIKGRRLNRSAAPPSWTYKGTGELNGPISIDGMVVMSGDVVVGDEEGVVAFDRDDAQELLSLVHEQQAREADALAAIAEGRLDDPHFAAGKLP